MLQVVPEKLGEAVRDGIRSQLLDQVMLHHLEMSGVINWNTDVVWQARPVHARAPSSSAVGVVNQLPQEEWMNVEHLSLQLEECYHRGPKQAEFTSGFNTFQVDYEHKQMVNRHTGGMFEVRRLAFAPLMPLKVGDPTYHVAG